MKSAIDWRIPRKHFLISFAGAMSFAVLYCVSRFAMDYSGGRIAAITYKYDTVLNVIAVGFLWCVCAWICLRLIRFLHVFVIAIGLTWGTVATLTAINLIQNSDEVSGWLPIMVHGALVIPIVTTVSVLPFWYFGRRRNDWNAKRMNYCLKIVLVTPLLLIWVYSTTFACYWFLSPSKVTAWQGGKTHEVQFKTSIPEYWRPAFWFVKHVCKFDTPSYAGGMYFNVYVFTKFLDASNP